MWGFKEITYFIECIESIECIECIECNECILTNHVLLTCFVNKIKNCCHSSIISEGAVFIV